MQKSERGLAEQFVSQWGFLDDLAQGVLGLFENLRINFVVTHFP